LKEAVGMLFELLRRFGNATANAATGFLFSEDFPARQEEQDEEHNSDQKILAADSAEIKEEHVKDSPLDAICQDLSESMDRLGASQDNRGEEELTLTPDIPSHAQGMEHAR
jgi:hypothetical protein